MIDIRVEAAASNWQLPCFETIGMAVRMNKPTFYEIRVIGELDDSWTDWFNTLSVANLKNGEALLSGVMPDQAALQGILKHILNLGLTLISVNAISGADLNERHKEQNNERNNNQ